MRMKKGRRIYIQGGIKQKSLKERRIHKAKSMSLVSMKAAKLAFGHKFSRNKDREQELT